MNEHSPGTVVITGASASVGRATALAFARRRWNVALIARGAEGLQETKQEIEQGGGKALTVSADVADAKSIFEAADLVAKRWGGIKIWINNAMVTTFSPVSALSPDEFRRITEVNLPRLRVRDHGGLEAQRQDDCSGGIGVGLSGDPVAVRLLRREMRNSRVH